MPKKFKPTKVSLSLPIYRVAFHPPTCTLDPFLPFSKFIRLSFPLLSSIYSFHRIFFSCWWVYLSLPNLKIFPLILFSSPISSRTLSRAHKKQPISTASTFSAPIPPSCSISDSKESRNSATYLWQHFLGKTCKTLVKINGWPCKKPWGQECDRHEFFRRCQVPFRAALSRNRDRSHRWLFNCTLIKSKLNYKLSSSVVPATFQVLDNYLRLETIMLDGTKYIPQKNFGI